MKYNVKLVKTILSLSKEQYSEFNKFLVDVDEVFPNNLDLFNYIMNKFIYGKRRFLNRNVNNFINQYRGLLGVFEDQGTLISLTNLITESYGSFLKFVQYINKKIKIKDKMLEAVEGLEKSGIFNFELVDGLPFAVECCETKDGNYHRIMSTYSDGKCSTEFIKQEGFTKYYIMDLDRATYVIHYRKDNIDGLKKLDVFVQDLEFDPNTLPEYSKLYGKISWQNLENLEGNKVKKIKM